MAEVEAEEVTTAESADTTLDSPENLGFDPETGEVIETAVSLPVRASSSLPSFDDLERLEEADEDESISIEAIYHEFGKAGFDDKARGFFQGFQTWTKDEPGGPREIKVATWLSKRGLYACGAAALVGKIQDAGIEPGTPILITYLGEKVPKKGGHKFKDFTIKVFNL
jgi:hypothetical protein